jgi:hypothetical protein
VARASKRTLQSYPRRADFLAQDSLFPRLEEPLSKEVLKDCIDRAFVRSLTNKKGDLTTAASTPGELVNTCIKHLKERSDPILGPALVSRCQIEDIFELDAISHELQRQRMKIGVFYQFLVIELMKQRFTSTHDGDREGDVEADITTPGFAKGLRIYMSVKKSADTVGGQDVGGMLARLEDIGLADKNLTMPYLGVVAYATPPKGIVFPYEQSRSIKRKRDGQPYTPNCEVWSPGFIYPFIAGFSPNEVYRAALEQVEKFLPFNSLAHRKECAKMLASELKKLNLVNEKTNSIDPVKFQNFICQYRPSAADVLLEELIEEGNPSDTSTTEM